MECLSGYHARTTICDRPKKHINTSMLCWSVSSRLSLCHQHICINLRLHSHCCTHSTHHGILFPFSVCTTLRCSSPDCVCYAVQARLCHKRCRHDIGLGSYLLSMMSSPYALVAVPGFSSFHFCFAPLISASFAIHRCFPLFQLLFCYWSPPVA